jgi:hypothetical protein
MRVIVCGGREPTPDICDAVWNWVMENCSQGDVVIHGACRGVDEQAMIAAQTLPGVKHLPFEADWRRHGRAAGPIRNSRMLEEGKPDFVVAFPGGRGTANMVKQAEAAGVPVRKVGWV